MATTTQGMNSSSAAQQDSKKEQEQQQQHNKEEARRGLLKLMMTKFSSTPLQENEYTVADEQQLRNQLAEERNDIHQYDAALTPSEREYLSGLLKSGDTSSIQSASAVLRDEHLFPKKQQLLEESSSTSSSDGSERSNEGARRGTKKDANEDSDNEEINSDDDDAGIVEKKMATTPTPRATKKDKPVRDSVLQQQLFRLHETVEDVQPSELLNRMNFAHQNSILADDFSTSEQQLMSESSLRFRSTSPTVLEEPRQQPPPDQQHPRVVVDKEDDVLLVVGTPTLSSSSATTGVTNTTMHDIASRTNSIALSSSSIISSTSPTTNNASPPLLALDGAAVLVTGDTNNNATTTTAAAAEDNWTTAHADHDPYWNPFDDISSWLDGSQGVEVTGTGVLPHDDDNDTSPTRLLLLRPDDEPPSGGIPGRNDSNAAPNTITARSGSSHPRPGGGSSSNNNAPFRILGTSADDVSCHPHVLSPPLMESLLAFVPEYTGTIQTSSVTETIKNTLECSHQQLHCQRDTTTTTTTTTTANSSSGDGPDDGGGDTKNNNDGNSNNSNSGKQRPPEAALPTAASSFNFWLKYSLVRDGPSLWAFLRQVRASTHCFLAIETDEGHVFGAFTSQPWRLSKGWYGSKDTFLWKMRRSRLETAGKSIVQQVCQESEIQVYPYRTGNAAVQYCTKKCLMLGQGEIIPSPRLHNPDKPRPVKTGKHYGYALYLDKDLTTGTTSSSETFGNPCLIDPNQRGARFHVSNIEVWTLTPHDTVAEAEQSELSNLFLDGGRDGAHRLNFMNILVGGPI